MPLDRQVFAATAIRHANSGLKDLAAAKLAPRRRRVLIDGAAVSAIKVAAELAERVEELAARLAAIETKVASGLEYRGVFESGRRYERNSAVTYAGSVWISRRETTQQPGDGSDWTLAVKRGKDASDAR